MKGGTRRTIGDADVFFKNLPNGWIDNHAFALVIFHIISIREMIVIATEKGEGRVCRPEEHYAPLAENEMLVGLHHQIQENKNSQRNITVSLKNHSDFFWTAHRATYS